MAGPSAAGPARAPTAGIVGSKIPSEAKTALAADVVQVLAAAAFFAAEKGPPHTGGQESLARGTLAICLEGGRVTQACLAGEGRGPEKVAADVGADISRLHSRGAKRVSKGFCHKGAGHKAVEGRPCLTGAKLEDRSEKPASEPCIRPHGAR
jgi:hypothetical protein